MLGCSRARVNRYGRQKGDPGRIALSLCARPLLVLVNVGAKWCKHSAPAGMKMLSLVRLVRLRKKRLHRARSLRAAFLLKLVDPVGDGADHVACRFLCRFSGSFGLLRTVLLTIALVALDDFDRGFLSHNALYFLS